MLFGKSLIILLCRGDTTYIVVVTHKSGPLVPWRCNFLDRNPVCSTPYMFLHCFFCLFKTMNNEIPLTAGFLLQLLKDPGKIMKVNCLLLTVPIT